MARFDHRHFLEARRAEHGGFPWGRIEGDLVYFIHPPKKRKPSVFHMAFLRRFVGEKADEAADGLISLWAAAALVTARERYSQFRRFREEIEQVNPSLEPFTGLEASREFKQAWQIALNSWAGQVMAKHRESLRSANQRLGAIRQSLLKLNRMGLCPKFEVLAPPRNSHKTSRQRPNLLQQVRPDCASPPADDEKAKRQAEEQRKTIEDIASNLDPTDKAELTDALVAMAANLPNKIPATPEEVVLALKDLAEHCLLEIRKLASSIFVAWETNYNEAQQLIAAGCPSVAMSLRDALEDSTASAKWLKAEFSRLGREFIPNALLCFRTYYGDMPPSAHSTPNRQLCEKLYLKVAGRFEFDAMLAPSPDAVAAAMLLVACESALNVSPLCDIRLPLGFAPAPDVPKATLVGAIKARANGSHVISILSDEADEGLVAAPYAMSVIERAGATLRASYMAELQKREASLYGLEDVEEAQAEKKRPPHEVEGAPLFVYRFFGHVEVANISFIAHRLSYFLRDSELNRKYKFTPSAIRPSVLLVKSLAKSPDSLIVATLAGHAEDSTATSLYQFQLLQRIRLSAYARQYQQKAIDMAKDLPDSLRVEEEQFFPDSHCTYLVELTDDLCLNAYLTKRCLERSNEELVRTRKTHWLNRCEPELAWATVVLEKASSSAIAHRLPFIERKAEEELACGYAHFLEI